MFKKDQTVYRRNLIGEYPTASMQGVVMDSDDRVTTVRWADGGISILSNDKLS